MGHPTMQENDTAKLTPTIKILMMQIPVRKRPLSPHTIKMAKQVSYLSMEHMYVKI